MTNSTIKEGLERIASDHRHDIRGAVATEALDHDEPDVFLRDVLQYGCVSGLVGSLIYYADTMAFFDQHYDEIETLRHQYDEETGRPLAIRGDLRNDLAWFAFETTAEEIAAELEIWSD